MKSFASSLIVAGAFAAQAAIDFGQIGTVAIGSSNKLNFVGRATYDATESTSTLLGDISVKYTLSTDIASKQFTLAGELKLKHKGAYKAAKSHVSMFQCWKQAMSNDAKDMRCFAWEYVPTSGSAVDNQGIMKCGIWKSKVPGTAHQKTDVVATTKTDTYITGTTAFPKTAMWDPVYLMATAQTTFASTTAATLVEQNISGSAVAYNATTVGLSAKPTYASVAWGTAGKDITWAFSYKPAADADNFYTNGKLYAAALYTLSQSAANAYVGFTGCDTACAANIEYQELVSPTLSTAVAKIRNAGAATTTTLAGTPAFTSGTVTAVTSQLDMFTVSATTAELSLIVTQTATLGAAITTTDTQVQQMTCFPTYTTAPKQYLCFLADHNIDASTLTTTSVVSHQVWHSTIAPVTTSFATATNLLDGAAVSLNLAAQKAFKIYHAQSASASPGEEAPFASFTLPEPKFQWRNGNYIDFARTGLKSTIGYSGIAKSGQTATADGTATITTIKTGVATAGFTGTAAKASSTVMKTSAATAFTAPVVKTCDQSQSYCTTTYPTVCKTSGAASLAAAGAAILALSMAF